VAVKTPKKRDKTSENDYEHEKILQQQRESLIDELKIMYYIGHHDNVLQLIGALTKCKDNFCIITEYCEFGSLDIFLKTKIEKGLYCDEIVKKFEEKENNIACDATHWKVNKFLFKCIHQSVFVAGATRRKLVRRF
jgi:serine/threonine protein kinase